MKNIKYTVFLLCLTMVNAFGQTPHGVKQVDKEHKNLWESPEAILIAVLVVIGIIVARYLSNQAFKRRNKKLNDED